jgi:hypothetical protein
MRNVLDISCRENKNTYFTFNNFFFSKNRIFYEIMSKNIVETERPQMTSQYGAYALRAGLAKLYELMRMHTPTRRSTHMHARTRKHAHTDQYVILIAFPLQQWFLEHASVLRYTYIVVLLLLSTTHNTHIHDPGVIRTRTPSKCSATWIDTA